MYSAALGRKKRDLDFEEELYDLVARSGVVRKAGDVAKDIAHRKATDKINDAIRPKPHVDSRLVDAGKKYSAPKDPKLVE
jgi:hypothetical protein